MHTVAPSTLCCYLSGFGFVLGLNANELDVIQAVAVAKIEMALMRFQSVLVPVTGIRAFTFEIIDSIWAVGAGDRPEIC